MEVHVTDHGPAIYVSSPFVPGLPDAAKSVGGIMIHYDTWMYAKEQEDVVRDVYVGLYGSFRDAWAGPFVGLRIQVDAMRDSREIAVGWQTIACRVRWHEPVHLAEYAAVVGGGFPESGGTEAVPSLQALPGTVIEATGLLKTPALHFQERWPTAVELLGTVLERARILVREEQRLMRGLRWIRAEKERLEELIRRGGPR